MYRISFELVGHLEPEASRGSNRLRYGRADA
jgi:hypothetical protein